MEEVGEGVEEAGQGEGKGEGEDPGEVGEEESKEEANMDAVVEAAELPPAWNSIRFQHCSCNLRRAGDLSRRKTTIAGVKARQETR